jgi:iron complex outermembrane receptor protein
MNRGAIVARWTVDRASGAQLQMQTSLDGDVRDEPVGLYRRQMAEVDVQYHVRIAARHDVVLGGSVRVDHERFDGRDGPFALTPPSATDRLGSTFVQDEITVTPRLVVTGGARIEHDHFAGWGLQPTARVMFTPGARHHVWAATSRALRTPSLQDLNLRATLPGPDGLPLPASTELSGDPALSPETLSDVEAGYRVAVGRAATVSATAFVAHYTKLRTQEPGEPTLSFGAAGPYLVIPVSFDDLAAARTRGVEFNAEWRPAPVLRVDGSLTTFALTPSVAPESRDAAAAVFDGDTPARQANLHVAGDLPRGILADARVFYVGALRNAAVPAYTRLDARFEVPLTRALSLAVIGQNLSSPGHAEFDGISAQVQATRVPRSGRLMLSWRF